MATAVYCRSIASSLFRSLGLGIRGFRLLFDPRSNFDCTVFLSNNVCLDYRIASLCHLGSVLYTRSASGYIQKSYGHVELCPFPGFHRYSFLLNAYGMHYAALRRIINR